MKKLKSLAYAFIAASLLFTSCGGDEETDPIAPTISSSQSDVTVAPGDTIKFDVTLRQGDAKLSKITVRESGNQIASDRLIIEGEAAQNSEYSVSDNATISIMIVAPNATTNYFYAVQVIDKDDLKATFEFTATVQTGTAVTTLTGQFFNNAGANKGGFDLSAGAAVSTTTTTDADIIDNGIDVSMSDATNWKQSISAANGAMLYTPAASFSFGAVATVEEISAAITAGTEVTGESDKIEVGDMFLVKKGDEMYAIKIDAVNITTADNLDSYEFSVKF